MVAPVLAGLTCSIFDYLHCFLLQGYALFHLKQYAEAAGAFHSGLRLNPTDAQMKAGFWDSVQLLGQTRAPLR